jgi:hypothetical protein
MRSVASSALTFEADMPFCSSICSEMSARASHLVNRVLLVGLAQAGTASAARPAAMARARPMMAAP